MAWHPFGSNRLLFLLPVAAVLVAVFLLDLKDVTPPPPAADSGQPAARGPDELPLHEPGAAAGAGEATEAPARRSRTTEGLSIEGIVADEAGKGFRGCIVIATPASEPPAEKLLVRPRHFARADRDGNFRIDGLGKEEYRVSVFWAPGYLRPVPVLARGGAKDLRILLVQVPRVTIRVTDPDGNPVRRFEVVLIDTEGNTEEFSGRRGSRTFVSLDPNRSFTLRVIPEGKLRLAPVEIRDWGPTDTDVRLRHGGRVSGVVIGPDGESLAGASVWWRETGGEWRLAEFYDRGKFICRSVFSESVTLRAGLTGGHVDDDDLLEVTAENGTEDLVFRLDPGLDLTVTVEGLASPVGMRATLIEDGRRRVHRFAERGKRNDWFAFRGLKRGATYTFMLVGVGDQAALVKGLRPEDRTAAVKLRPGLSIRGHAKLSEGTILFSTVSATCCGLTVLSGMDETGFFEFSGLTEGVWQVKIEAYTADQREEFRGEAQVQAGGSVNIELKPVD